VSIATVSYKGHRYPFEIMNQCVGLYFRFPMSFREIEEHQRRIVSWLTATPPWSISWCSAVFCWTMKSFENVSWVLKSGIDVAVEAVAPPDATFEGGKVFGFAGCNQYVGSYTLDGATLDVGDDFATTRMGCGDIVNAAERAYLAALGRVRAWRWENGELALLDADDVEVLRYRPAPLVGSWVVTGLHQGDAFASPLAGTQITATFDESGALSGSAGCNIYNAPYSADAGEIEISEPATTEMFCGEPDGIMAQEAAYLAALPTTVRYRLDRDSLKLSSVERTIVSYQRAAAT